MSSQYNLDEEVNENFEFILGGFKYKMRFPNTEEILQGQQFKEGTDEQNDWLFSFIEAEDDKAPPIKEALKTINVKKLQKFAAMIKKEFAAEEDGGES